VFFCAVQREGRAWEVGLRSGGGGDELGTVVNGAVMGRVAGFGHNWVGLYTDWCGDAGVCIAARSC
jgi:hypothetical protein